jgi:hypothetical protein
MVLYEPRQLRVLKNGTLAPNGGQMKTVVYGFLLIAAHSAMAVAVQCKGICIGKETEDSMHSGIIAASFEVNGQPIDVQTFAGPDAKQKADKLLNSLGQTAQRGGSCTYLGIQEE